MLYKFVKWYFAILLLVPSCLGFAQIDEDIFSVLQGNWEGAFIKNNSFQKFDITFYKQGESMMSLQVLEEWHPQFGEFVLPVEIDSTGLIGFNTGLGKAKLRLDEKSLEATGYIENSNPTTYVHFKKVPSSPPVSYKVEELNIKNGDISIFGHIHAPKYGESKSAVILVGGRGCYAGSTYYDLYAKLLREYGITVVVYNKRGTGKTTGDCANATIADLASDAVAIKEYLAGPDFAFEHIGIMGSSAGGWVMVKAEETTDFDFMISIVGPSTSVRDQQMQSMEYGFDFYKLNQKAKAELLEYTNLMFDGSANETNYKRFTELLAGAEKNGWKALLDDTDIPTDAAGISKLWVRRHDYDPGKVLGAFNNPFLAIYGEIDWIVPYKENIGRLNELFSGERAKLLTTVLAHDAEHGTETKDKYVTLADGSSYYRFFRISPQVQIEIIKFLKTNQFID